VRTFRPGSELELRDWVASAGEGAFARDTPIVTGTTPDRTDTGLGALPRLCVSTEALSNTVDFRPGDLTITVGSGMRLSALSCIVAEAGLWLPLAGLPEDRSVGGWVAAAPVGGFDGSYGPVRRHVLACTLVLWDGRITRWGRPVMKNVAGYDVPRILCGSRSRLGVLTTVTLRLWPRPRVLRRFELAGASLRDPGAAFAGAPRFESLMWHGSPGITAPPTASVSLAGGSTSVATRSDALLQWAGDKNLDFQEVGADGMQATPIAGSRRSRPATGAAYRITLGRRYLTAGLRDLERRVDGDGKSWKLEVLPATGVARLLTDEGKAAGRRPAPAWLTAISDHAGRTSVPHPSLEISAVRVERGGQAEHEAAHRLRNTAAREVERRWTAAFSGADAPWQADYL